MTGNEKIETIDSSGIMIVLGQLKNKIKKFPDMVQKEKKIVLATPDSSNIIEGIKAVLFFLQKDFTRTKSTKNTKRK